MTGSVELWLTVVPSLLWLLYRLFTLLKSPVESLVENLNLEIPHVPQICIDAVTGLLVVVHWDIEVSDDEELIYVVLVNNREAAMVNTTSCKLNQLLLNKVYQIEVLAVNVTTNFRSRSAPVFIETLLRELVASELAQLPFRSLLEPQNGKSGKASAHKSESNGKSSTDSELQFVDSTSDVAHITEPLVESELKKSVQPLPVLTTDQIKSIENPADLNFYLLMYQEELQKLLSERESFQNSVKVELEQLRQVAKDYKQKYNQESDMRVRLDNNIKDIEKKRDQLSFTKGKLQNQLKQIKSTSHLHESRLDSLKQEYKKYQQKSAASKERAKQEAIDLKHCQQRLKGVAQQHKKLNDQLESEIKFLTNEKKKNEKLLNTVKPLMEMFGSEANFTREGTLKTNSQNAMNSVYETMPEWKEDILEELDKTRLTELEWRLVFKTEIRKYLAIKNNLEMAKAARIKGYTPQKLNEYQASLEFGGYNHALSKLSSNVGGFKSKLSKFSIIGKANQQYQNLANNQGYTDHSNQHQTFNDISTQQESYNDYSTQQQPINDFANQQQGYTDYSPSGNIDFTQDSKSVDLPVGESIDLSTQLGPSISGVSGSGSDVNVNTWNNYFGQVYSNDNSFEKSNLNNDSLVPEVPLVSEPSVVSHDTGVSNMNLQLLFLGDQYYNNYSQTLPPNLWQNNQQSTSNYVPLNGLAYQKDQFYGTPTNSSGNVAGTLGLATVAGTYSAPNGSSNSQAPFGELFSSSMNHSSTSFQSGTPIPVGGPSGDNLGSLRSQVLLQKLDMALQQLYIGYNLINPSHQGLESFLGTSQAGTSFLDGLPNNGSGILQLPNSSQPELSDPLEQYSKSLSPQLGSLLLNKSNLWGNSPFSHTRNLLSNSQIWRNESSEQSGTGEVNLLKKNERSDLSRESKGSEDSKESKETD